MRPVAPQALAVLVRLLETSAGRIVEEVLDKSERDAFDVLRDDQALKSAEDVPWVLCPVCGEHDIAPRKTRGVLQGVCPACGYVPVANTSLKAWEADLDWLLGRLRMAFGIASRQDSTNLVPGTCWKIGDHKEGRRSLRLLFARRLADQATHQAFRDALTEKVERDNAVIIATTSKSAAMVSDIALPYVHLAEIVHYRSGKLELDAERWAWCLKPGHMRQHDASPVFFENFRVAVIEGNDYAFSLLQARVFAYLHAAQGRRCFKDSIMDDLGSSQRNPLELFRHNACQLEGFRRVVAWDDFGFYWLKRS